VSLDAKRSLRDVKLGENVQIFDFVNLYGCEVGDNSKIGTFVEIQKGARIGRNVKVSSHTFICEGVTVEDDVFIGHNVSFINDKYPRATANGRSQTEADWTCIPTLVRRGASIGTSATILCGVTIGEHAIVGAGSVVTADVPAHTVVAGVPARSMRSLDSPRASNGHGNTMAARIPLVDLKVQYREIEPEIRDALTRVLEDGTFTVGPQVDAFEEEFAAYCGARFGIGLNSGTSALHLALLAAGVGPGDEVITVPFTFAATVAAVLYTGARPVFVDVEPDSLTLDARRLEGAITARTKAIIPVHLYGQPGDLDPILDLARHRRLTVIEDAAQAHGAEYRGRRVGGIGHLGCFSFYPGKNLGAYGEAGMVVTNDPEQARMVRMLRNWGQEHKYYHTLKGYNFRMDAFQGAVLRVKLRHLERWTEARRAHAALYDELLADSGARLPVSKPFARHVYHLYAVRVPRRDAVAAALRDHGIDAGIHYPIPVHLQQAYADLGYGPGDFPCTEQAAEEVLSLPMYPELTEAQIRAVSGALKDVLRARA
jgi:dTDP-4-amino-4,6-dideoxygalactose transaminase/acetyltransferase-like isoleucine patch superfamily enzyme